MGLYELITINILAYTNDLKIHIKKKFHLLLELLFVLN